MDEQTDLLREIRDLLLVMAEPSLAKRDEKLRASLLEIVERSKSKAQAVLSMNGSRTQSTIRKETAIDQGDLSRLVTALRGKSLLAGDDKNPKLSITVQPTFFDSTGKQNG